MQYHSDVSDPVVLDAADAATWNEEADVVVAGFGGAGAAASIQARELGAEVIALDRFRGGGATAFSGGIIYAGGTHIQREAGFADSAENMFNYLAQEASPVRTATLRRFCDGSSSDLEWLAAKGVKFDSTVYEKKTVAPPDGYNLYYSGNEKVVSYAHNAVPAPRGHRTVGDGAFTGYAYYAPLKAAALASGVRFLPHSPVPRACTHLGAAG